MADNAELRIILQDDGQAPTGGSTPAPPGGGGGGAGVSQNMLPWLQEIHKELKGMAYEAIPTVEENIPNALPADKEPGGDGIKALAAIGGPIGAVHAIIHKINETLQGAEKALRSMSDVAVSAVKEDLGGAAVKAGKGLADLAETVMPMGGMFKSLASAALAPIEAFNALKNAMMERARELGAYSGEIATADVLRDMKQILRDMDEANKLGPEYARMIDAQSRLEDTIHETLLPIKEALLSYITDTLLQINDYLEAFNNFRAEHIELISASTEAIVNSNKGIFNFVVGASAGPMTAYALNMLHELRKLNEGKDDDWNKYNAAMMELWNAGKNLQGNPLPVPPMPQPPIFPNLVP